MEKPVIKQMSMNGQAWAGRTEEGRGDKGEEDADGQTDGMGKEERAFYIGESIFSQCSHHTGSFLDAQKTSLCDSIDARH